MPNNRVRHIIGLQACKEALRVHSPHIRCAWLKQHGPQSETLKFLTTQLEKHKIHTHRVGDKKLNRFGPHHQGLALECHYTPSWQGPTKPPSHTQSPIHTQPPIQRAASTKRGACDQSKNRNTKKIRQLAKTAELAETSRLCVALDGLVDPHNLGAILRTCWLLGVEVVIIPTRRAAQLTPTVHKVACGGAEHVPVESVTNIKHTLRDLQKHNFTLYGLSAQAPQKLWDVKLPPQLVWVLGAEEGGLKPTIEKMCDQMFSLPQSTPCASFNASVALAMALAETRRQWPLL